MGPLAYDDTSGGRGRLQPGGCVHDVARRERLPGRRVERDDGFSRGDGRADLEAELGTDPVQLLDPLQRIERGANGSFGVIVVGQGRSEHRHHRVADELLHDAAEPLDAVAELLVVPAVQIPDVFGVGAICALRGADHVDEQHGHELPLFVWPSVAQLGAARRTEPRTRRCLRSATGTAHRHIVGTGFGRMLPAYHPAMDRSSAHAFARERCLKETTYRHLVSVEGVMRALARRFDEDQDLWGLTGLFHDLDQDHTGDDGSRHALLAAEWLRDAGVDERVVSGVLAHAYEEYRTDLMSKAVVHADAVAGLLVAAALVRPEKATGMKVSSVKKKLKEKAFAPGVNREEINDVEECIGLPLEDFLAVSIEGLQEVAPQIDL
jgi:putative nucleotidyltransferase with HDIG domain